MEKIRIKNLRSLVDTGEVPIKPLTIIVGENSVGKSTFVRSFPLLKQSISVNRSEPILWYSPDLVDFGTFDVSINDFDSNKSITFEFSFFINVLDIKRAALFNKEFNNDRYFYKFLNLSDDGEKELLTMLFEIKDTRITKFSCNIFDYQYEVTVDNNNIIDSFLVNDTSLPFEIKFNRIESFTKSTIIPNLRVNFDKKFKKISTFPEILTEFMKEELEIIINGRITDKRILDLIHSLPFNNFSFFHKEMKKRIFETKTMKDLYYKLDENKRIELAKNLYLLNGFSHINLVVDIMNNYLYEYYSSVQYITPIRSKAERYYRKQGLSMDEISPQGENIPMILYNMSKQEMTDWKDWTYKRFGIKFEVTETGSNISMELDINHRKINLTDSGFGFSQLLPIVFYAWKITNEDYSSNDAEFRFYRFGNRFETLIIEQPELHLHPAMQSLLTDVFVELVHYLKDKINIEIILETHSETIVNRVGEILGSNNNKIDPNDIQVLIFEDSEAGTKVRKASYTKDGYLENWPIGFFSAPNIRRD